MSLSAVSRHPVGQTIKTPLFLLYEWGWNSEEQFIELDTRHITLVLPVCERLLLSYKLSHTVSSQNRANLLPPAHPKRSVVSCNMANLNLTWHPSTSREQTFVTCHPLLSFPRIDEVSRFYISTLTVQPFSAPLFITFSSRRSYQKILSPPLRHFSLIRGIAPTVSRTLPHALSFLLSSPCFLYEMPDSPSVQ